MGSEWTPSTLDSDVDLITGFPFKSNQYVSDADGIKLVRGDNIVQGSLRWDGVKLWSPKAVQELNAYFLVHGDVVLAMDRPWIEAGLKYAAISKHDLPSLLVQRVARLRGSAELDSGFLRYLIGSRDFTDHVIAIQTGTAVPHISGSQIKAFRYLRPPLPEQKAIAGILGALDDKIELNRRMNRTLEGMARAIFQSWFVDFDPVRAKAEGKPPAGLSPALAALFPDAFEPSELGEIPKGWRVQSIGDLIERIPVGQKYDQKTVNASGVVPVLDQGKSGIIGFHDDAPGVLASTDEPVVVFANHTCYMRLIPFPFSAIQNVLPFKGKSVSTIWAYYATFGKQSFIEYKGHWPDFIIHKIVVSQPELAEQFSHLVHPIIKQLWSIEEESRTLAALRDALLPKLISGELRVPDAELIVGRAT